MESKPGGEPELPRLEDALGFEGFRIANAFTGETMPGARDLVAGGAPDGWADILDDTLEIGSELLQRDETYANVSEQWGGWDMVSDDALLSEITDRLNAARHERQLPTVESGVVWRIWSIWNSTDSVVHKTSPEIVTHELRGRVSVARSSWKGLRRKRFPADEAWNKARDEVIGMIERNYPPNQTEPSDSDL